MHHQQHKIAALLGKERPRSISALATPRTNIRPLQLAFPINAGTVEKVRAESWWFRPTIVPL